MNSIHHIPHIAVRHLEEQAAPGEENPFRSQLIDVRTPAEFYFGHVEGAILVPLPELSKARLLAEGTDTDETVFFICRSGVRSLYACQILIEEGCHMGVNVTGGSLAWVGAKLPFLGAAR